MNWLIVAILAYLIFAVVFLVDKSLLSGPLPSPKIYIFYASSLRILAVFLIPFVGFSIPASRDIFFSFFVGAIFFLAGFWFYKALWQFEASKVVPAVGGMIPVFSLLLVYCFSFGKEIVGGYDLIALALLISGSVLINYEFSQKFNLKSLQVSAITAFFFALYFSCSKIIYLSQPFWTGLILINVGASFTALLLLFSKEVRNGLLKKKVKLTMSKKMGAVFVINQAGGAGASVLQSWAVALAPFAYVAVVNAMQGVQYVFILIFTIFISLKFPKIFKEEINKSVLVKKVSAILLIGIGLAILATKPNL